MPDYGTDISTFPVVDLTFAPISGRRVVAEAIARRLSTPRGTLFWDPQYGTDLRVFLNDDIDPIRTPMEVAIMAKAEAVKDDRVVDAVVFVSFDARARKLSVHIALELSEADRFEFVLGVDQVTVQILEAA
jgi:hypothetical protein